jgi:hypothetical protein
MALRLGQYKTIFIALLMMNSSFLLCGCETIGLLNKQASPSNCEYILAEETKKQRTPTQESIKNTISIRDKFLHFYNENSFDAAHSQIVPIAVTDYPIASDDIKTWRHIFTTQGDILMIQIVAAYQDNKELFDFITNKAILPKDSCVHILKNTAEYNWTVFHNWAVCYSENNKNPGECMDYVEELSRGVINIENVLGPPSGFCH